MKYSLMWVSPIHKIMLGSGDILDDLIITVELWHQQKPRAYNKPKIMCNTTGRVVYE